MIESVSDAPPDRLQAALAAAQQRFRAGLAPGLGLPQVLAMLFIKSLSDVWQERHAQYQAAHGEHPALVDELLRAERFVLPAEAAFQALHAARHAPGNGGRLDAALQAIEAANPGKLRDVFRDIGFNTAALGDASQRNERLRLLLEDFAAPALDLRPGHGGAAHAAGRACEALLNPPGAARLAGLPHGTPPEVAQLMAQLVDPQEGDEICDPFCGSAQLLVQCARQIRQRTGRKKYALYGQEAVGSTWALARLHLFLQGEDNHRVEWGDSLRNPRLLDPAGQLKQFDVVLARPPFSPPAWSDDAAGHDPFGRFRRGVPPSSKPHYAVIQHMVAALKPGSGRMAVVVPHGVLFRGAAEAGIRRRLIADNLLDAVIGLPDKLFPGTGMAAAVLVLRRTRRDDRVLFIDASRSCQPGKNRNVLRAQDLAMVARTVADRRDVAGYARLAGRAEMAGHGDNLHIAHYVGSATDAPLPGLAALQAERARLSAECAALELQMAACLRDLGRG